MFFGYGVLLQPQPMPCLLLQPSDVFILPRHKLIRTLFVGVLPTNSLFVYYYNPPEHHLLSKKEFLFLKQRSFF